MLAVSLSLLIGMLIGLLQRAAGMVAAMIAFALTLALSGFANGIDLAFLATAVAAVIACNLGLVASFVAAAWLTEPESSP